MEMRSTNRPILRALASAVSRRWGQWYVAAGAAGEVLGGGEHGVDVRLYLLGCESFVEAEQGEPGDQLGVLVEDRGLDVVDRVARAWLGVFQLVVFVAELGDQLGEAGVELWRAGIFGELGHQQRDLVPGWGFELDGVAQSAAGVGGVAVGLFVGLGGAGSDSR
jgi:hypothetical protein